MPGGVPSGTVTFLVTDIEGSTLFTQDGHREGVEGPP